MSELDSQPSLASRFYDAVKRCDEQAALKLWGEISQTNQDSIWFYGREAIEYGCWDCVSVIFSDREKLNGGFEDVDIGYPLDVAYGGGGLPAVRKMLELGARPWHTHRGCIKCYTMTTAVEKGDLETVRFFVELGIDLQRHFTRFFTWLDWAIWFGQTEVAEYLKSQGAVHFDDIDPKKIDELYDPETVVTSYLQNLGFDVETIRKDQPREFMLMSPITILLAQRHGVPLICTAGLRNFAIAMLSDWRSWPKEKHPPVPESYFILPPEWPIDELQNSTSPHSWPVHALNQLAYYLAIAETDVGIGPMYVPSGNQQTLIPGKDCPGALIVEINEFLDRTFNPDFEQCDIGFFHIFPLYRNEADYLRKRGYENSPKGWESIKGWPSNPIGLPFFKRSVSFRLLFATHCRPLSRV